MWMIGMILGIGAVIFAGIHAALCEKNKDAKWFGHISLSLTALTLCAIYSDGANMVAREDWAGLMDVMPMMSRGLWVCVIASILVNSASLFSSRK